MARYGNRVDNNHAEVRESLRSQGWEVLDTHDMPGFVDLIVKIGNVPYFIDVKNGKLPPSRRRLTDKQKELARFIPIYVITTAAAIRLIPADEYIKETES